MEQISLLSVHLAVVVELGTTHRMEEEVEPLDLTPKVVVIDGTRTLVTDHGFSYRLC
jgi:hypothetical protein